MSTTPIIVPGFVHGVVATSNRKPPLRILIWPHSVGNQARRLASCQIGKHKFRYGWPDYFWIADHPGVERKIGKRYRLYRGQFINGKIFRCESRGGRGHFYKYPVLRLSGNR